MADETLVPEWMKQRQIESELAEAKEDARLHRVVAAGLLIEREGPKFWQQLMKELKIAVDALPVLKMQGSYTLIGQDGARIDVSSPGIFANFTYTNMFRDDVGIRCSTLDAGAYRLLFRVVSNTEIGVVDEHREGAPMNPSLASQYVLGRMVDLIERRRR